MVHSRTAVVTNPSHDVATRYLHVWSDFVIANVRNKISVFELHELIGKRVTKQNITKLIEETNPQLIMFHGHGGRDVIFGFDANILIECGDNEQLLINKIIHSLTCDSGDILGPKCIHIGTKAFIGYKKEFKFAHTGRNSRQLRLADNLARIFLEPAFEIDSALLDGATLQQAYERSQKKYKKHLEVLMTSKDPIVNKTYASGLYHDMVHQVALGDRNSTF